MGSQDQNQDEPSLFELPPYVAESIVHRMGYTSLEEFEQRTTARASSNGTLGTQRDPQESLREQIQEFLIASDDEDD